MSHVLQLFCEKFVKTSKRDSSLENLQVLAISTIFHSFPQNEPRFATFSEKFLITSKPHSFLEKLRVLAKSTIFDAFSRNEPRFATFFGKVDENLGT